MNLQKRQKIAGRFEAVSHDFSNALQKLEIPDDFLYKTDDEFFIEVAIQIIKRTKEPTKEKKRALRRIKSKNMFFKTLEESGGTLTSSQVADLLGVSKVTVKSKKDKGILIALKDGSDFLYPAFQFNGQNIVNGISDIIAILNGKEKISDRMIFSFFNGLPSKQSPLPAKRIIDILKTNPNEKYLEEIKRLARLYGSQDAR